MNIYFLNPGFMVPAILSVLMLMIPITVFTQGRLSIIKTVIMSLALYSFIIILSFPKN